jgi:hypothetical protein
MIREEVYCTAQRSSDHSRPPGLLGRVVFTYVVFSFLVFIQTTRERREHTRSTGLSENQKSKIKNQKSFCIFKNNNFD